MFDVDKKDIEVISKCHICGNTTIVVFGSKQERCAKCGAIYACGQWIQNTVSNLLNNKKGI